MSEANEHVLALLPAHALGILSPQEAETVQQHLDECASCREELQAYEEVGAELALAVPETEPPAALEQRLMDRVTSRPESNPSWLGRLQARAATIWEQLRLRPAWAATTALALLLVVFLIWTGIPGGSPTANFPTFVMAGTNLAPEASGIVISSEDGLHGTVVVQRLPTLDEETQAYQLWLIEAGAWEDGGIFSVDEDGYGARYASADILLTSYDAFAVTVEPAGGSSTPTGQVVLHSDRQ
mgnify:CR=1 FL=1